MSDDDRAPIENVLPNFRPHALSEDWTPLQAFVLVKALDEDGEVAWAFRTSELFNLEELLGALTLQVETLTRKLVKSWEDEDPDYTD
jgi:hypothetical protein